MSIPDTALPIVDWEDSYCGATDTLHKNVMPLCPHCNDWSYYSTDEAEERGGYILCPFCGGAMYMPSSPHNYSVKYEGDKIIRVDFLQGKISEDDIDTEDVIDIQGKQYEDDIDTQGKQTEVYRFADCDYCDEKNCLDGEHCLIEAILNGTCESPSLANYFK